MWNKIKIYFICFAKCVYLFHVIKNGPKILKIVITTTFVLAIILLSIKNISTVKKNEERPGAFTDNKITPEEITLVPIEEKQVDILQKDNLVNSSQIIVRGINSNNQLGISDQKKETISDSIISAPEFIDIAVGNNHSVGLTKTGEVYTWGHNDAGQLGRTIESKDNNDGVPTKINFSKKIISIDAVYDHTILLAENGTVWGFGSNFTGQLGDGTNENSTKAVQSKNISGIIKIATGDKFTLALNNSGEVYAWGGSCAPSSERILKQFQQGPLNLVGGYYDPFIDPERGYNQNQDCLNEDAVGIKSKIPRKIDGLPKIKEISAGYGHALMLSTEGKIWSFGCNLYGQLGHGKFGNFIDNLKEDPTGNPANSIPKEIANLENITSVKAGYRHSVALDSAGKVYTWGFQTRTENQGSKIFNNATPAIIYSKIPFKYIQAGYDYSIFTDNDQYVYSYGVNTKNLISPKNTTYVFEPTKLFSEKISKISGGKIHLIGLKK